jgi:cyclic-di-AMP phosphodiesterase PgpH
MDSSSSDSLFLGELKFAKEKSFFETSIAVRWLIGVVFTFCLFLFLHFRQVPLETLDLGSKASKYIVTQVDLDYFDQESTILRRNQAIRDLKPIYLINPSQEETLRESIRKEIQEKEYLKSFQEIIFLKLNKILSDVRFVDPKTYQQVEKNTDTPYIWQLLALKEEEFTTFISPENWKKLFTEEMTTEPLNPTTIVLLSQILANNSLPIEIDNDLTKKVRKEIQEKVPEQFSHMRSGSRIIDKGETVTPRHILILYAMQAALNTRNNLWNPLTMLGSLIIALVLTAIFFFYFNRFWSRVIQSNRKLFLLVTIVLLCFAIAKIVEYLLLTSSGNLIEYVRYPIIVPFASIIIASLIHPSIAIFVTGLLTLISALALIFEHNGFILLNLVPAFIVVLTSHSLKRRKEAFSVCGKAFISVFVVIIGMHLYRGVDFSDFFWDVFASALFLLMTAVLVVGMLPLLESLFGIMTDITLMEYMDPNHEILRRLTLEAPGTYQHSVLVGNLAESAASAIGANGLFCRVATLYHDIGKMATPQYFSENQEGSMNIHQLLTPEESAQVIISHVSEGVALAKKANLPEQFIDIIKEHHGTTLVRYFLSKQLEQVGGDHDRIDITRFRYSGPKPRSRESLIIMLADSLEAASRSLNTMNEKTLTELMEKIVRDKIQDRQFDRSILTLEELTRVKIVLVKTLLTMRHSRVKYPEKVEGITEDVEG